MNFQDYNINITTQGAEVRTICPKCSPSRKKQKDKCLAVNTIEGCWHCHHCGWSGGLGGKEQKVFEIPKDKLPQSVIAHFKSRGISEGILKQEYIGFEQNYGKGWIKFPYFKNSVCVNIKYKSSDKQFRQEKGGYKCLYRLDKIIKSTKTELVITEGEIDTLSCLEAGYEATSIPDGAPSPETKHFNTKFDFLNNTHKIFEKYKKIILAGDNDKPGEKAIYELARRIGFEKCYVVKYPDGCKDINDVLKKESIDGVKYVLNNAKPFPVKGIVAPEDCYAELLYDYEHGVEKGLSTGWAGVDKLYTIRTGEMTIVTGIPGSGKSNFVDALCMNLVLKHNWRIGVFSPENWPVKRHMKTLLEKLLVKSFDDSEYGERMTTEDIKDGTFYLQDYFKFIIPQKEILSVDLILDYARILCLQYGIKGLIIDPWNELEHQIKQGEREDQYISKSLTKIRQFARANGLHIWVIAHPKNLVKNSEGNYDPPTMYDISGGAHWRNKADNGICVYRDFDTNLTTIIIQKIRFREIGQLGETNLKYTFSSNYKQI